MGGELIDICDICKLPIEDAPGIVMLVEYDTKKTIFMHEECEEMSRTEEDDAFNNRGW